MKNTDSPFRVLISGPALRTSLWRKFVQCSISVVMSLVIFANDVSFPSMLINRVQAVHRRGLFSFDSGE